MNFPTLPYDNVTYSFLLEIWFWGPTPPTFLYDVTLFSLFFFLKASLRDRYGTVIGQVWDRYGTCKGQDGELDNKMYIKENLLQCLHYCRWSNTEPSILKNNHMNK